MKRPRAYQAILLGGLIAGALDITYACVFSYIRRGTKPITVLQSVASGALGRSALAGGAKTAALGLLFHFLIALILATVYYFASRVLRFMVTQAVICGILYGVGVYLFMNCVVLRLSAIHATIYPWSYPKSQLIGGLLIHMFGMGLPIALTVRWGSRER
ncbi:MAG TPA: hypothetical protein VLQ90_11760 [Pyrinomonadaceae bacterium]|nr:hypothetical protein [Pyrinomonadaceae bacterium]